MNKEIIGIIFMIIIGLFVSFADIIIPEIIKCIKRKLLERKWKKEENNGIYV